MNTPEGAGGADLIASVEQAVAGAVGRFEAHLTRVEVHLGDVNAEKGGARDKRCLVEARPTDMAPIAVSHQAATVPIAMSGKLGRALALRVPTTRDGTPSGTLICVSRSPR
ncbi:hypothetical protein [Falsiroseomonas sp.]|uniref:hypothetical protein n=1 Tax=Falsiroseomonas sp. TaxID=2870721 RepID=UPI0027175B99|nr:hypothetical protein [Falsiroseomonas sp.]MDO9500384.1 hypothetical protein [Falsiroseomonas sp.]